MSKVFAFKPKWNLMYAAGAKPRPYSRPPTPRELQIMNHPDLCANTRLFAPKQHHVKKPVLDLVAPLPEPSDRRPRRASKQ